MRKTGIALLLLLVACGRKEPEASPAIISVADGGGEIRKDGVKIGDLDISVNENSVQCAARPDFVPLFPGAKIDACAAMGPGGTVSYTVPVPPAQVLDFYKGAAKRSGFTKNVLEQGKVFGAHGADGRGFTVVADEKDGGTSANVIWGFEAK